REAGAADLAPASRSVQRDCGADESLECGDIDFVSFVEVDRTPGVAFEAGVEELRRILELRSPGERQLDDILVGLARADQSVMSPRRDAPLPFFGHPGIGLFDERAHPGEHLAAPVVEIGDSFRDELRCGFAPARNRLLHAFLLIPLPYPKLHADFKRG